MSEWFKEHAWKACVRQKCTEGSNPSLSANKGANQGVTGFIPLFTKKIVDSLLQTINIT